MMKRFLPQVYLSVMMISLLFNCIRIGAVNPEKSIAFEAVESPKEKDQAIQAVLNQLSWTGQASVRVVYNDKVIYIDPLNILESDTADLILITHPHGDHLSTKDIIKISTSKTKIVVASGCKEEIEKAGLSVYKEVLPGDSFIEAGFRVQVVSAYTISKQSHPKEKQWVGYVVDMGGVKLYHPGDTQRIPEMKAVDCDIALMPLGQTYTMDKVEDAVDAVLDIQPKIAIPFHYGMYEGTKEDAILFQKLLKDKGIEVIILE